MDHAEILSALDLERRTLVRRGEVLEATRTVVRVRGEDRSWHAVSWSSLTEQDADAAIEAEVEHHRRLGVSFEWKVYGHDAPRDMVERLSRRGFEVGPCEAVMVYDLSAGLPPAPGGIRVVRADNPAQVAQFRRVAEAVFDKDYAFTTRQLLDAIDSGSFEHRGYVAYTADQTPVGVGRLYTNPRSAFGGLYGGGTLAAYRGKGVYRAMVAARAIDAAASGARYLIVDALPTSRPILAGLGFDRVSYTWPCDWQASNFNCHLRATDDSPIQSERFTQPNQ
ncbi:GNAT family protein [Humisphaera borealis]|uniref:GNAT family N-acetyltransferase n=1 Tax=Humisphaera borealis TaxID=2807512 RepID=A0A7M2WTS7_9BACT|nr:hypothetical protein [Humisphaera borealis]QOV87940.1 GNAT family N-acetyltransferase [Humisphaera borealis]